MQTNYRQIIFILFLLYGNAFCFAQCDKALKMYQHHSIQLENDTIYYHTYAKKGIDSLNTILLYIQGSRARTLYQVKEKNGKLRMKTVLPFSFKQIPPNYLFVVISKKGLPFCTEADENFTIPSSYFEHQTLAYRAFQTDQVLKDLNQRYKNHFQKIIALGHSEGSDVVAKLGTLNKGVTHFGYWAGGGNTQWIDFITFIRKEVYSGKLTEVEALAKIDSLFVNLKEIVAHPNAIDKFWEGEQNSYKRWAHFSEPPIDNLLKIDKPLFVAIGTKDQAVPVESAYLIPIEFIRHQKNNLTFKAYPDLDHGFGKEQENGSYENHWDEVFADFLKWLGENK